ncbi:MAG: NAD(P)/FAD-dependent oxidoreductase [Lachnospiraceae bacterium]|nr:NAD(P)/FAD-dependent oxidoreductase [Lachnospiraceae bacterium]
MRDYDLVIIGGGPAGLAAAEAAKKNGIDSIVILERDRELGGILNQCIHNGFGLHSFGEELTGPEYAKRYIDRILELKIEYMLHTMVMDLKAQRGEHLVTAMNGTEGVFTIRAKAVILSMGCRERSRGALNIPGYRPAGIYSAGTAQRFVNMEGLLPGREVVILGSGDIGLIMARRMTLEGAKVKVVAELMPYSGGLKRNIVQCLDDFGIPLLLSHTVVDIHGKNRVEGVTLAKVDDKGNPIPETEEFYSCDTLLLSVGLIPENELSREAGITLSSVTGGPIVNESLQTSKEGIFACGNVLHVHDLVDFVSEEAAMAGKNAAAYIKSVFGESSLRDGAGKTPVKSFTGDRKESADICICAESGVRYTVPSLINTDRMPEALKVRFRVGAVYKNAFINVYADEERIIHKKRMVMAPGEMEEITLKKEWLCGDRIPEQITVKIEDDREN